MDLAATAMGVSRSELVVVDGAWAEHPVQQLRTYDMKVEHLVGPKGTGVCLDTTGQEYDCLTLQAVEREARLRSTPKIEPALSALMEGSSEPIPVILWIREQGYAPPGDEPQVGSPDAPGSATEYLYAQSPSADLDLRIVRQDTGALVASSAKREAVLEMVEFTSPATVTSGIQARKFSCFYSPRWLGWAWHRASL